MYGVHMNPLEKNIDAGHPSIPFGLASLAGNRDAITTAEFAKAISGSQQTLRKNYCLTGNAYGIKPIKVGNRLLWPVEKIARLINGT
jgi:hypothetical protein